MSYEFCPALINFMLSDSSLAALIGQKIYSNRATQRTQFPYLVLESASFSDIDSSLDSLDPVINEQWQFDALAASREESLKIIWAVIDIFRGFTGQAKIGDFWVFSLSIDGLNDLSELEREGGQQLAWRQTLRVTFRRAIDKTI